MLQFYAKKNYTKLPTLQIKAYTGKININSAITASRGIDPRTQESANMRSIMSSSAQIVPLQTSEPRDAQSKLQSPPHSWCPVTKWSVEAIERLCRWLCEWEVYLMSNSNLTNALFFRSFTLTPGLTFLVTPPDTSFQVGLRFVPGGAATREAFVNLVFSKWRDFRPIKWIRWIGQNHLCMN